jgi:hypothetical protein
MVLSLRNPFFWRCFVLSLTEAPWNIHPSLRLTAEATVGADFWAAI